MLRLGIVEDEIGDLISVIRNLMALDRSRNEFELVPILLSDPEEYTPEAIESWATEYGKKPLAAQSVDVSWWPKIEQMGMLCPADEAQCSAILRHLSSQKVNAIVCDSWIGKDNTLKSKFPEAALKVAGVMLLDAAEKDEHWQGRCWMMTKYQKDVLEKLFEIGGWHPEKFNPLNNNKFRYMDKSLIIDTGPGECNAQLRRVVDECIALVSLAEPAELPEDIYREGRYGRIVGKSEPMLKIYKKIQKVAPRDVPVLICGESGVGKELVARELHDNSSRDGEFIPVDCGAIPSELIEAELFGHARGAFTGAISDRAGLFEQAGGGTIFLDEISNLSRVLQGKLLRALQEGEARRVGGNRMITYSARVLAATNRDLEQDVKNGQFREDLYYRIAVINIAVPALRERREDVGMLCGHFIAKHAGAIGSDVGSISDDALTVLKHYSWPGNVRELENVIRRAIVEADGKDVIDADNDAIRKINEREPPDGKFINMTSSAIWNLIKQGRAEAVKTLTEWSKEIGKPKTLEIAELVRSELGRHPDDEEAQKFFKMSYDNWKVWIHRNSKSHV
jgi:DNA-binding NtrC family response regulator